MSNEAIGTVRGNALFLVQGPQDQVLHLNFPEGEFLPRQEVSPPTIQLSKFTEDLAEERT
jgi:hypothetical protein